MPTNGLEVTRRTTLAGGLALGALAGMPLQAQMSEAGARLRALLEQADADDALLDPLSDERRGESNGPAYVDPLGDYYGATLESNKRAQLAALQQIDRRALSPQDAIAYDVFSYRTREVLSLFDSGLFAIKRQLALDPSFGPHVEVADFVSGGGARFDTLADYERGLLRLEGFADYLQTAIARLREGLAVGHLQSQVVVGNVLRQVDAMLALAPDDTPFFAAIRKMPDSVSASDGDRLTTAYRMVIAQRVLPGYQLWHDFLTQDYLPRALAIPGRGAMPDGDRLYAAELARHTTTTLGAEEVHALGLSEVARIRSEMEQARKDIGFEGDLAGLFEHIRTDPKYYYKTPEDLLARFAAIEAKIWPAIPKLFARRPKAPFRVGPLPALGDQRGTGYYRPGPADGVSPGTLYFNMAMLGTRPIPTLETLTLHEGIPGHHFQITLARENEALPPILRFGSSTAYSEGWGLYAESLGRDLGMFTDPLQWFGHLDMEMLRAVRLVVDTGLHARNWQRQKAIDYMLANTSMAPKDVAVEIDRYIAMPGQACAYKIGEIRLAVLRERARKALGGRFDIRDYHDQVLGTGALPLAVLEAKIDRWIAGGGGASGSGF